MEVCCVHIVLIDGLFVVMHSSLAVPTLLICGYGVSLRGDPLEWGRGGEPNALCAQSED